MSTVLGPQQVDLWCLLYLLTRHTFRRDEGIVCGVKHARGDWDVVEVIQRTCFCVIVVRICETVKGRDPFLIEFPNTSGSCCLFSFFFVVWVKLAFFPYFLA